MRDQSLKDVFARFASDTTAHAPPKVRTLLESTRLQRSLAINEYSTFKYLQVITRKYLIAKIFWLFMFFTGIGVCIYFCQSLISTFLEFNTTTDIEVIDYYFYWSGYTGSDIVRGFMCMCEMLIFLVPE